MDKQLLLTRNSYDHSGLNYNAGLAYQKQNTAIASAGAYGAPAHEIGHLLGATHEDAELKFNGWVCETYTHPVYRPDPIATATATRIARISRTT